MSNMAARSAVLAGSRPTRATTSKPAARRARTWVTQPNPVPTTTTPVIGPRSSTAAGGLGGEQGRLGGRPGLEVVAEHLDPERGGGPGRRQASG